MVFLLGELESSTLVLLLDKLKKIDPFCNCNCKDTSCNLETR
jgi:hypothetical protein